MNIKFSVGVFYQNIIDNVAWSADDYFFLIRFHHFCRNRLGNFDLIEIFYKFLGFDDAFSFFWSHIKGNSVVGFYIA